MHFTHSVAHPLNREPPPAELVRAFLTPPALAYDRNHGPLPHLAGAHTIRVGGVPGTAALTLADLRALPQHTVTAALQCAGNRRATMRRARPVSGLDWGDGAVCNAAWTGPLLADVLAALPPAAAGHVSFDCTLAPVAEAAHYGGSLPLARCRDRALRVVLALAMNGAPLTAAHGFPVRLVAPGVAGARWTKWLDAIRVHPAEAAGFFMARDYKILPPHVTDKAAAELWWDRVPAIVGLPINSVVAYPAAGAGVAARGFEVGGYALPAGDDGPVVAVDVSVDGGATWAPAEIVAGGDADENRWAWALWKFQVPACAARAITPETKVWSRARDKGGNVQDGTVPWNWRGVAYNAYGETTGLRVQEDEEAVVKHHGLRI